jgi:tetratricopeptide (TPR) repeat protein
MSPVESEAFDGYSKMTRKLQSASFKVVASGLALGFLLLVSTGPSTAETAGQQLNLQTNSAQELARQALTDSLYYKFDKWFAVFEREISRLENSPQSLENRMELMKFNFYYSGLLGELSHTLAFTSKYKVKEISDRFIHYSSRTKELAKENLESPGLTAHQQAQIYMFLGGAEGYIGILEYGAGHLFKALVNGFQADTHLEKALSLDPGQVDAHFGLGVYRYGNSRLGGFGNFIMQGGRDLRLKGLDHIEQAILASAPSKPLALKTLSWFYISEQVNPDNSDLPAGEPLSVSRSRSKAIEFMEALESEYFSMSPYADFKGNKELAMMRALQYILDSDYAKARTKFKEVLEIADDLKNNRGFAINPQLTDSVQAGIEFSDLMLMASAISDNDGVRSACLKVTDQLNFLNSGGAMVEYDSRKIRSELHSLFADRLESVSRQMNC